MADTKKNKPYFAHKAAKAAQRRRDLLQLYVQHPAWTYYDLGQAVGLSAHRVGELVREALQRAAEDESNLAAVALARSIKLHQAVMEAAWEIVTRGCSKCAGQGTVLDEENPRTMDNNGKIIENRVPCTLCDHSSGYAYPYQARLGAMDRHQRAQVEMAKLLRLYEPDTLNINVNYRSDLANLPEQELARMLDEYASGYTDALEDHGIDKPLTEEVA